MMFSDLAANCIVLCCPASVTMPVLAEVDVRVVGDSVPNMVPCGHVTFEVVDDEVAKCLVVVHTSWKHHIVTNLWQ